MKTRVLSLFIFVPRMLVAQEYTLNQEPDRTIQAWSPTIDPESLSISSNPGTFTGASINEIVGADRFYAAGINGSGVNVANIEGGHAWSGHQDLSHITNIPSSLIGGGAVDTPDNHATGVTGLIGGRGSTPYPGETYRWGIAYGANVYTAPIATSFGTGSSFSATNSSVLEAYIFTLQTGSGGQTAKVFNSSWGFYDAGNVATTSGFNSYSIGVDALINTNRTIGVVSAGNDGPGNGTVGGLAAGYNTLSVGALGNSNSYDTIASFSSRGPSPWVVASSPTSGDVSPTITRARVDITAPGQNLTVPFYQSGSTASGLYGSGANGTSYSAPIVAGGATLLADAGNTFYAGNAENATDGRVIKAVLMNSAAKPSGWTNGQTPMAGVSTTSQSLDYTYGAGIMDLDAAFDQYVNPANGGRAGLADLAGTGTGDLGLVPPTGWDYGYVAENSSNDYYIGQMAAGTASVTLTWFVDRTLDPSSLAVGEDHFANLDLHIFQYDDPSTRNIIFTTGASISVANTTEHLYLDLTEGYYGVRVAHTGENWDFGTNDLGEFYGLAYDFTAIPEPGVAVMLLFIPGLLAVRRRV